MGGPKPFSEAPSTEFQHPKKHQVTMTKVKCIAPRHGIVRSSTFARKCVSPSEFSPLTPALSPFRGEGVDEDGRHDSDTRPSVSPRCPNEAKARDVAKAVSIMENGGRAPSPLNGERAGVRDELAPT